MGEGGRAERARGRDRGNMASVGKLRAPVLRQCGSAIENQAQQSLCLGARSGSRVAHSCDGAKSLRRTNQTGGLYRLVNEQDGREQNSAMERGAMLHVRYAEWYADLFKLEVGAHEWERRLADIADQSVTVSEATRKSFGAYSGRGIEQAGGQGDFDHYLLVLLGLGGFRRRSRAGDPRGLRQIHSGQKDLQKRELSRRDLALAGRSCGGVLLRFGARADRHSLYSDRSLDRHR